MRNRSRPVINESPHRPGGAAGFSLIELMVVIVIFGAILAFSVPALGRFGEAGRLKAATEVIASELRLSREKAISTGQAQQMHFTPDWVGCGGCDYHIHNNGVVGAKWDLPKGISLYSVGVNPLMQPDGRSNSSGIVILRDTRGNRDTISVQLSGLVLTK